MIYKEISSPLQSWAFCEALNAEGRKIKEVADMHCHAMAYVAGKHSATENHFSGLGWGT